jgi:flagellar hook-associated protein 1 FlgK
MGFPQNMTFEGYLNSLRLQMAVTNSRIQDTQLDHEIMHQQRGMVDSVSWVSLDEEAINIVQYQKAYETSSRVISITDKLMQTLINII